MVAGMDNTDLAVLCALILAVTAYWRKDAIKDILFSNDDSITADSSGSRDIVQVMKKNKKDYLVLYASQTGTAEDYAKKFSKELTAKFSLNVMCADVEKYDFESLSELPSSTVVSIFVATYGEGEFPDGAIHFEDYLNELNEGSLNGVHYTLFGLGNSTYEFYNGASKKVRKLMERAGATMVGEHGLADDGAGTTDEDYLSWKEHTLEILKEQLKLSEHEQRFEPSFSLKYLQTVDDTVSLGEPSPQYVPAASERLSFNSENIQLGPFDSSQPYLAPITKIYELLNSQDRSCIHGEFDVSGSNIKYTTGDHLAIWPSNANEKVEKFLYAFSLNPDTIFDLKPLDSTIKLPFPTPTTVGAAVRHYLEITGPISRQSFGALVQFAPSPEIKEKLESLAADKEQFHMEITSKYFDLADAILYLSGGNKWETVPWGFLIESITHLQPRYYSISSSSSMEKQSIHVTAMVEDFPNPAGGPNVVGVTTNLLKNIELEANGRNTDDLQVHFDLNGPRSILSGFKLPVHVRRSAFRLPSNPQTPVIMIGPGTGVAPFRGFIRERVKYLETTENAKLGKHLLFYGSRNENDFLYRKEWPVYAKKLGTAFEMIVAHSRLQTLKKKVYVQDKLTEREKDVITLLNQGAFLYVCGDAKGMAQGVNAALVEILSRGKSISKEDAAEMVKMLKTTGRYQEDVW